MRSDSKIVADVLRRSLIGIICCLLLGVTAYSWNEALLRASMMRIIAEAVIGTMFFFTLRVNRRNAFAVLFVLFVLQLGLVTRQVSLLHIFSNLFFVLFIAVAIYIFFTAFYLKTVGLRYLHPLVLATLFTVLSLVMLLLNFLTDRVVSDIHHRISFVNAEFLATDSFVVGLGIGISVFIMDSGYDHALRLLLERLLNIMKSPFQEFGERL